MILMSCVSAFYYIRVVQFLFFNVTEKPKFYYTPSYTISVIMVLITFLNVFFCCAPWLLMDILYYENLMFFLDNFIDNLSYLNNLKDVIDPTLLNNLNNVPLNIFTFKFEPNNISKIDYFTKNVDVFNYYFKNPTKIYKAFFITNDFINSHIYNFDLIKNSTISFIKEYIKQQTSTQNLSVTDFINNKTNIEKVHSIISMPEYIKWITSLDPETQRIITTEFGITNKSYIYSGDAIDWYQYFIDSNLKPENNNKEIILNNKTTIDDLDCENNPNYIKVQEFLEKFKKEYIK